MCNFCYVHTQCRPYLFFSAVQSQLKDLNLVLFPKNSNYPVISKVAVIQNHNYWWRNIIRIHEKVYAMISDLASSQISKYISLSICASSFLHTSRHSGTRWKLRFSEFSEFSEQKSCSNAGQLLAREGKHQTHERRRRWWEKEGGVSLFFYSFVSSAAPNFK